MHINKKYKLLIYIILILVLNFSVVGCDRIGFSNILSDYRLDPIIKIDNKDLEEKIITHINNYFTNGSGFTYYDNGWIYFSRRKHFGFGDSLDIGELYKMKEDATEIKKLSNDAAANILVEGDWIYYINNSDFRTLYKIRIDGTERIKINDEHRMFNYILVDDWIYFNEYLNKKGQGVDYYGSPGTYQSTAFSRMRIDGSDYQKLLDIEITGFNYDDEYIYAKDESFDFLYGGILRIKRDDLNKEKLESNEIEYEVIFEEPVSGTYFITPDNKIIDSLIEDDKRYIIEENIENSERRKLAEVDFNKFNIKDGWIYGINYINDEENKNEKVQIQRVDKNKREILIEFAGDSNSNINIAGDWILYNSYDTVHALSLDGKESKELVESYSIIGDDEKDIAKEKINKIEEILEYFSKEGYYYGECLDFMIIKDLEIKYDILNFGVVSEDNKYYMLDDLFKMTSDEIANSNIVMEEIDTLKFILEYYESLVKNKGNFISINNDNIDEAMAILKDIKNSLDYMDGNGYIDEDKNYKYIDLTKIDKPIFYSKMKISLSRMNVVNKKGEICYLENILELNHNDIIELSIRENDLKEIKYEIDKIMKLIYEYEESLIKE